MATLSGPILDTWYVGGLRGTGGHDVVVDDVFVPAEKTFTMREPDRLNLPISRLPFGATMSAGCAEICLGLAQAALDTLVELSSTKKQVDPTLGLRDRPSVQALVATAAADVDGARLLLHSALDDVWANCEEGIPVTPKQRARVWRSAVHAARKSKSVVTAVYEAAGSSALLKQRQCALKGIAQYGWEWRLERANEARRSRCSRARGEGD